MTSDDRGSTIPLILGFFVLAMTMVAGSITLGQAFVQQRDLQDVCDGAASAAAASSANLDRGAGVATGDSLRFGAVGPEVTAYLARDVTRHDVRVTATFSPDRTRVTLTCRQTRDLALGRLFGRPRVEHIATSTARAAVLN